MNPLIKARAWAGVALVTGAALLATGCTTDAARVSENLSTEADNFGVERLIVGLNTRTGEVLFSAQGRCSITRDADLIVICKEGPDAYKKHYFGRSTDTTYVSTQLDPIDADVYRTKIILKPTNIVPDFDLSVGER